MLLNREKGTIVFYKKKKSEKKREELELVYRNLDDLMMMKTNYNETVMDHSFYSVMSG